MTLDELRERLSALDRQLLALVAERQALSRQVAEVKRSDNFFNLGGHSLMGAQLIARVKQTFDVELPLRSLFDHPTIREISSEIDMLLQAKLNAMSDEEARRILETSQAESSL